MSDDRLAAAADLLKRFVELVPEPELVSMGYDSPPEHRTSEEHELGYALRLAREFLSALERQQPSAPEMWRAALEQLPQPCACRFEWRPTPDFSGAPPKLLEECGYHATQRARSEPMIATEPYREFLGRFVRMVWIEWAREQPNQKTSWLVGWEELTEPEREVDRRIGERVAEIATINLARRLGPRDDTVSDHATPAAQPAVHPDEYGHWDLPDIRRLLNERDSLKQQLAALRPAVPEGFVPTHAAADAFWKYWREYGETHKHGYYESTWCAIKAALAAAPGGEGK